MSDTNVSAKNWTIPDERNSALWLFFPDYRGSNPYQTLLAEALEAHAIVAPGTPAMAFQAAASLRTLFHLHWEDAIYAEARNEEDASSIIANGLDQLAAFQALGGIVIWTMHNATPHEDRFPALSLGLRRALAASADLVHVHCQTAADLALELGTPASRLLVVRHPDLAPAYPNDITDEDARRFFDIVPDACVFAYLGAKRGYKDLDLLSTSFTALHALCPDTNLILGGRQAGYCEQRFLRPEPGVRLIPRFVDDAVIQYVIRAADFVVLPYRRILTSGAVALALGFGRPVIVPNLPALLNVVEPEHDALVYRADDDADLLRVLIEAASMTQLSKQSMRERALLAGRQVSFFTLADAFLSGIFARRTQ